MRSVRTHRWVSIVSVGIILIAWEASSRASLIHSLLFPPPSTVIRAFTAMIWSGILVMDAAVSLSRVLAGLSIAIVLGIVIGLLTGRHAIVRHALSPLLYALKALPPVAIIPLVIVWFGIGDAAKIFSIALAAFFPIWMSTHIGATRVPQEHIWSASLLTRSRLTLFSRVIFPATLPYSIAGIRIAISIAFIMAFVSELAGAESGLGYRISITQLAYRIDQMMAALLALALLSTLSEYVCERLLCTLFPWLSLHDA